MFIDKQESYFTSSNGKNKIYSVFWIPDEPKMMLQIAHGMVEHILRYEVFAKFLNSHGILVYGNDHLGHGRSVDNAEQLGYFSDTDGDKAVVDDMHKLTQIAKEKYPNLPCAFLGHSMGSFMLRSYLCRYGSELDAAIIMGTGSENPIILKAGLTVIEKIAAIKGWHYRSKVIDRLAIGSFNKKFGEKNGGQWLSRDENEVKKYAKDPLSNFMFTLNAYYNFFKVIHSLTVDENLKKMPKNLPVLFVAGDNDPVGGFGTKVLGVYEKFKSIGMQNVECKLYKGYRHEILNEIGKEEVYNDILNWLNSLKLY